MVTLAVLSKVGAYDSPVRHASGDTLMVLTHPLNRLWEALLPRLGFEGESVMLMAIPILLSWIAYAMMIGFAAGWSISRLLRIR